MVGLYLSSVLYYLFSLETVIISNGYIITECEMIIKTVLLSPTNPKGSNKYGSVSWKSQIGTSLLIIAYI